MDKLRSVNIQKFDGKNFQLWKYQLEIILRSEKLLDIVNGTKVRSATDTDEQNVWDEGNSKAMLILSTAMEFEQLQAVITCSKAADMWARLKAIHEQRSAVNKITLKQHFFNYKMSDGDTIAQHLSKIESMSQALADVGEPVSDVDKLAKTLGSLPPQYGSFITAWDSYEETKQTFDNLTARLLKEEQRMNISITTNALAAVKVTRNKTEGNKKINKRNVECFYCHKKGHFKSECRKLQERKNTDINNHKHQAFSAEVKNILLTGCEDIWLADSAASRHMTAHKEWFVSLKPIVNDNTSVQIGDNSFVEAEGVGSVEVMSLINGKWEPRTLEDTLYVPKLKKNLFSVGAVAHKNLKVTFDNNKMEIGTMTGILLAVETYFPRYRSGEKTYIINLSSIAGITPSEFCPAYSATKHGIIGLTRSYGLNRHLKKDGIFVAALCPSGTDTAMGDYMADIVKYRDVYEEAFVQFSTHLQTVNAVGRAAIEAMADSNSGSAWFVEDEKTYKVNFPLLEQLIGKTECKK